MLIASFVRNGVRIDLPIEKGWTEQARQASAESRQRTKQWAGVEKPVLGRTQGGNWLYQRLLSNVKRRQYGTQNA